MTRNNPVRAKSARSRHSGMSRQVRMTASRDHDGDSQDQAFSDEVFNTKDRPKTGTSRARARPSTASAFKNTTADMAGKRLNKLPISDSANRSPLSSSSAAPAYNANNRLSRSATTSRSGLGSAGSRSTVTVHGVFRPSLCSFFAAARGSSRRDSLPGAATALVSAFSWRSQARRSQRSKSPASARRRATGTMSAKSDTWFWNEESKQLDCDTPVQCQKSLVVRALMNKYQPTDRLKDMRGAMGKLKAARAISTVQEQSIHGVVDKAYNEMAEAFIENKPVSRFGRRLVEKAGPSGYDDDGRYWNSLPKYFKLLSEYVHTDEFKEFLQGVIDYYRVHLKKLLLERDMAKNPNNYFSKASRKELQLLENKKKEHVEAVGVSYAGMLLGLGETQPFHHMLGGVHRYNSMWKRDQILTELVLEFIGKVVMCHYEGHRTGRYAGLTLTDQDVQIELGYVLRTRYFDPHLEEKTYGKVDTLRKEYYDEITLKPKRSMTTISPSSTSTDASSGDNSARKTVRPQTTRDFMRKRSARLAAERRVRGKRPSSAVLAKQNSPVIAAALKHFRTETYATLLCA